MADDHCSRMSRCEMFGLFTYTETLAIWKARYCEGDYERCERRRRLNAGEPVPPNLLPNGQLLEK